MAKIDIGKAQIARGSGYPAPFHLPCESRSRKRLGDAAGLADFGVNLLELPPGTWSSQRHWHSHEDEFVYVLSGEVALVTDSGETILRAGDCAGFPKGSGDGHHMINRGATAAVILEVGTRSPSDVTTYSDIDMKSDDSLGGFVHKDGTPYPARQRS